MEITIINGSPRKNGATFKILNYLCETLKKECPNVSIVFYDLIDCKPKYCIGCQICYKTGKCIETDDQIEQIHDQIEQSDGVIFGSPTNGSNVSGLFKVFHDRVHMADEQLLYRKPCINLTTYELAGGNSTLKIMKNMIMIAGGYVSNAIAIKCLFNQNPLTEKNRKKLDNITKGFIAKIRKNSPPMWSKIYNKLAINLFFKPFILKHKEHYKGVIDSWIEKKLLRKKFDKFLVILMFACFP